MKKLSEMLVKKGNLIRAEEWPSDLTFKIYDDHVLHPEASYPCWLGVEGWYYSNNKRVGYPIFIGYDLKREWRII